MGERGGRVRGHWSFLQEARYFDDFATAAPDSTVVSLRRTDANWQRIAELPLLEEITVISPSKPQLDLIGRLGGLKRLRLGQVRQADVTSLADLAGLEELALISVSGPTSLAPLGRLPRLRALYVESMRSLSDWSGLTSAPGLTCLEIFGSPDKRQRIDDLAFLDGLPQLDYLQLALCQLGQGADWLAPLARHHTLGRLQLSSFALTMADWAYLQRHLGHVEWPQEPWWMVLRPREKGYGLAAMTIEELAALSDARVDVSLFFKGMRNFTAPPAVAAARLTELTSELQRLLAG